MTDKSKEFSLMLGKVLEDCSSYKEFISFDFTKNVQDQLQKIVSSRLTDKIAMHRVGTFNHIIHRNDIWVNKHMSFYQYYYEFISMEQLWLAFVMKEKYSKQWNGKEWITIKRED